MTEVRIERVPTSGTRTRSGRPGRRQRWVAIQSDKRRLLGRAMTRQGALRAARR
jgi:hypothetical protein